MSRRDGGIVLSFDDVLRAVRRRWRLVTGVFLLSCIGVGLFVYSRERNKPVPRYRAVATVQIVKGTQNTDNSSSNKSKTASTQPVIETNGATKLAMQGSTRASALIAAKQSPNTRTVAFRAKILPNNHLMSLTVTALTKDVANNVAAAWAKAFRSARRVNSQEQIKNRRIKIAREVVLLHNELRSVDFKLAKVLPAVYAGAFRFDRDFGNSSGTGKGQTSGPRRPPIPDNAPVYVLNLAQERPQLLDEITQLSAQSAKLRRNVVDPDAFAAILPQNGAIRIVPVRSVKIPAAAGLLGGLLLGIALAVLIERRDRTIRDPRTAAAAFAAPVLSLVPSTTDSDYAILADPMSDTAEAYRSLAATSIATDRLPKAIMVSTPHGDAHEEVAANYAAALSRFGLRVALIATTPDQSWYAERFGSQSHRANGAHHDDEPSNGGDPNGVSVGVSASTETTLTETAVAQATDSVPARAESAEHTNGDRGVATFPELLIAAHEGTLNGQLHNRLSTDERAPNLMVVPPSEETPAHMPIDGLPPLLLALNEAGIDITVVSGPALLEDADATIVAWATRCVLWAIVEGEITSTEARAAAARLELAGVVPFGVVMVGNRSPGI